MKTDLFCLKALIVEPSRMISGTLKVLFARHGILAHTTPSGREALIMLECGTYDLLSFSYELTDMNGIDLFNSARSRGLHANKPALMFAATHDKAVVSRALACGVTECFSKLQPAQFEQFIEKFSVSRHAHFDSRVLLVEDSAATTKVYLKTLERLGLHVDVCTSAEHAIMRFETNDYDLVITDYVLAGTESGFAVIRAVRAMPGRKAETPIIVISGFDNAARKVEILRNGASDYVVKPVIAEELEVRVTNLLLVRQLMQRLQSQGDAMRTLAMHDQLTSLYNRHYLETRATALIEQARAKGVPFGLLVIDLDRFKQINEDYGHLTGDHVLEQVANAMRRHLRPGDTMARVGGEKFVCLMPDIDLDHAQAHAEELRNAIATAQPAGLAVTASVGVALLGAGEGYDDLFRRADAAVYRAKANGRDRVESFD